MRSLSRQRCPDRGRHTGLRRKGIGGGVGSQGGAECPCQPLTLNTLAMVKDADALKDFISFYQVTPENRKATFDVDIHALDKQANERKAITHADFKFLAYDIPLRAPHEVAWREVKLVLVGLQKEA